MYDYESAMGRESIWNSTTIKTFDKLTIKNISKNGTHTYTWDKSAQSQSNDNWTPDMSPSETISTVRETIV